MKSVMRGGLVWLAAVGLAGQAAAEETALAFDPSRSQVDFTLGAALHTVHGTFQLKRGSLRFDAATGKIAGEIVLDATSAATGNESRDKKMHKQVLESSRYAEIVFRPDRVDGAVEKQGTARLQVHGVFAIHGVEQEMTVPVTVDAADGQYTVAATFTVPYVKWGMKDPSTLFLRVSDKVQIAVRGVARPLS